MYRSKNSNGVLVLPILLGLVLIGSFLLMSNRSKAGHEGLPTIHFFSADVAPVDGVVAVFVQYGVKNAPEGWLIEKWSVSAGEQMNREVKVPSNKYARAWFRAENSNNWMLLPSQYWHGGGSCGDEFGVSARSDHPSYHTYFANGIGQAQVPLLTDLGACPYGSFTYSDHEAATPLPPATVQPTPVPTATLCVVLTDNNLRSPCGG